MAIYEVSDLEDLEKQLTEAGDMLVLIDFFANWCGPCKVLEPVVAELASKHASHAIVLKVDVEKHEDIAIEYDVTNMPSFMFVRQNNIIYSYTGSNAQTLTKLMDRLASGLYPEE